MRFMLPAALVMAIAFAAGSASAAETTTPAKPLTPQQQKMKDCNAQATGKTGDERKTFMSNCLKADSAPAKPMTQQEKMTMCNQKAAGKTGDERKAFMSQCLKSDSSGAPAAH